MALSWNKLSDRCALFNNNKPRALYVELLKEAEKEKKIASHGATVDRKNMVNSRNHLQNKSKLRRTRDMMGDFGI